MRRKVKIGVGSLEDSARRFVESWRKLEQRKSVESQSLLTFDNLETLLRILTPTRWTLVRTLRRKGPLSIRALAKFLKRDYKNVHTDVRELERIGLIARRKDGMIVVPWDKIVAEVDLEAA